MDTTIRNLDAGAYRALRARAVLEGRTVGDVISEAIRVYLARARDAEKHGSLRALKPEPFPEGNDGLSSEAYETVRALRGTEPHARDVPRRRDKQAAKRKGN